MTKALVILGRDGLDDEADFTAWVTYVVDRIDERTGLDVAIQTRNPRDVQDNGIYADDAQAIRDALRSLWDDFCADTSAWPIRG